MLLLQSSSPSRARAVSPPRGSTRASRPPPPPASWRQSFWLTCASPSRDLSRPIRDSSPRIRPDPSEPPPVTPGYCNRGTVGNMPGFLEKSNGRGATIPKDEECRAVPATLADPPGLAHVPQECTHTTSSSAPANTIAADAPRVSLSRQARSEEHTRAGSRPTTTSTRPPPAPHPNPNTPAQPP